MPQGEDHNEIIGFEIVVQRYVTSSAARDDELSQAILDRPTH
jgi:hypothetical protein